MSLDWALEAFSSLIQNSHSFAGTMISAFGNAIEPSAARRPLVWSGCKWDKTTASMLLGSTPAAARFCIRRPTRPLLGSNMPAPKPQSMRKSLEPGLTSCGLKGGATLRLSLRLFLRDIANEVIDGSQEHPIIDRGAFDGADLVAIETGSLGGGSGRCRTGFLHAKRKNGGGADRSRSGQKLTAIQIIHDSSPPRFGFVISAMIADRKCLPPAQQRQATFVFQVPNFG